MIQHVMIAVDDSAHSRLALKVARAHYPDARRELLTVVDPSALSLAEGGAPLLEEEVARAGALLRLLAQGNEVGRVLTGDPVSELVQAVRRASPDVLVIGTHGRSGMGRWLRGSVAEEVLRRATVPVLAVHEASVPEANSQAVSG